MNTNESSVRESYGNNIYNPIEEALLLRPLSRRLASFLAKFDINPNTISFFSFIVLIAASGIFAFSDLRILSAALVFVALVLDKTDGDLARARGIAGPKGQYVDSVLDHLSEIALTLGIALGIGFENPILLGLSIAGPLLFNYHGVATPFYLAQIAPTHRENVSLGLKQLFSYGRAKHLLLFILLILVNRPEWVFYILPLLIPYTLILFLRNIFIRKWTQR